jgi:hypothetical protein
MTAMGTRKTKWILCVPIAVLIGVLAPGIAAAQGTQVTRTQDRDNDATLSDVNPCNGHIVQGQGHQSFRQTEKPSGSGSDVTVQITEHGNLIAPDFAAERYQYSFSNSLRSRSSTPNFTMTFQTRKHIVRQGGGSSTDSYFQYDKVTVSGTTPPSSEKEKVDCK